MQEKLEIIKKNILSKFNGLSKKQDGNKSDVSLTSKEILKQQKLRMFAAIMGFVMLIIFAAMFFNSSSKDDMEVTDETSINNNQKENLTLDLADKALDSDKHWRSYFEDGMHRTTKKNNELASEMEDSQAKMLNEVRAMMSEKLKEISDVQHAQLMHYRRSEKELRDILHENQALLTDKASHVSEVQIDEVGFGSDVIFDDPKSAEDYIPEGTFFTGHLLGGVVVSTALNTADDNATPVIIRLSGKGNLDLENKLDISQCKIMGSAYGDLSSERAVVRLEKMICKDNGYFVTSDISGLVYGDDGFNGIKGSVVSTSSKHIQNAIIGGVISGVSGAAKGKEGMNLSAGGLVSTKSKGMGDIMSQGALGGVSNAGDKIADYYLRQAESLSPILTIPAGAKVNTQITKGFFVGQRGIQKKIKQQREENKMISRQSGVDQVNSTQGGGFLK